MKINLIHKNIAILWYWKEWESTLRFLQKNGILDWSIAILDQNKDLEIKDFSWKLVLWENYLKNIDKFDYVFKSPWISPYTNWLDFIKDKILTQTKIFYEFYPWKIISVTQTKWKSTTATLAFQLLKNAWYKVKLVWNIWNPVLDEVNIFWNDEYDYIVYELSSYMLDNLENHHSYISIFWNIFLDHIDWHLDFDNYFNAKKNILKNSENILIWQELYPKVKKNLLNRNFLTFGWGNAYYSHIWNDFLIKEEKVEQIISPKIPWEHNLNNFSSILWICDIIWIDHKIYAQTINNFLWLPHRLQNIWTFSWVTFIDDAISTTPESTIEAIKSFLYDLETIFLWGTDRWYDFKLLAKMIENSNIKNIVLFPKSWKNIKKSFKAAKYNIFETDNMESAIEFAFKNTSKWKVCLLSTASPSYTLWKNFEAKWDDFKNEILKQYKSY